MNIVAAGLDLTTSVGFSPSDLFASAISLAGNFSPYLMLGLSFLIAPWIFKIVSSAVTEARAASNRLHKSTSIDDIE